jgi:hypothetical protein
MRIIACATICQAIQAQAAMHHPVTKGALCVERHPQSALLLCTGQCATPVDTCRYALGRGLPGLTPTSLDTPAAIYRPASAMGPQSLSTRPSAPRVATVRASRAAYERQFVCKSTSRALHGRDGPGPALYDIQRGHGAIGAQVQCARKSPSAASASFWRRRAVAACCAACDVLSHCER